VVTLGVRLELCHSDLASAEARWIDVVRRTRRRPEIVVGALDDPKAEVGSLDDDRVAIRQHQFESHAFLS